LHLDKGEGSEKILCVEIAAHNLVRSGGLKAVQGDFPLVPILPEKGMKA